jgi:hypothetical protein
VLINTSLAESAQKDKNKEKNFLLSVETIGHPPALSKISGRAAALQPAHSSYSIFKLSSQHLHLLIKNETVEHLTL